MQRILFCFLVIGLAACDSNRDSEAEMLSQMQKSLDASSKIVQYDSEAILGRLEDDLRVPFKAFGARLRYSKALRIQDSTNSILAELSLISQHLSAGSVGSSPSDVERFWHSDKSSTTLRTRLIDYRASILDADTVLRKEMDAYVPDYSLDYGLQNIARGNWSKQMAHAALSRLRNGIINANNTLLRFCMEQVTVDCVNFESYSAILGQSHQSLRAGQILEITAGVGSFTVQGAPKFTFEGKTIPFGDNATAIYKLKVSDKLGKYSLPVQITYTDQDGKRLTIDRKIEYEVRD